MGFSSLAVMGNSMLLHLEAGKLGALPASHSIEGPSPGLGHVQAQSEQRREHKAVLAPATRETMPV